MAKWAHILNNKVQEITHTDPEGRYHESFVWVPCSDDVQDNWTYENGTFSAPIAAIPSIEDHLKGLPREEQEAIIAAEMALAADPSKFVSPLPEISEGAVLAASPTDWAGAEPGEKLPTIGE